MANLNIWIHASRPRTLPLALAGIFAGSFMAAAQGYFQWDIFLLACATAVCLQILSNWANDYGDGVKGADNAMRRGPKRAVSSGAITRRAMLRGIVLLGVASLILGFTLISTAFDRSQRGEIFLFVCLGIASIGAAVGYSMGRTPYGYRGWGDLSVFLFFGLVPVLGVYCLYGCDWSSVNLLPAVAIGAFSIGVLNLNNLRDYHSDKAAGKNTVVVQLGFENGKVYQLVLTLLPYISILTYNLLLGRRSLSYLFLLSFVPAVLQLRRLFGTDAPAALYTELKRLASIALSFSILFGLGECLAA
ncbi:MAG: 1,4-dihydroxy-2-naphthoate octaprenyltransferase [Flavobacteriales bacterium]